MMAGNGFDQLFRQEPCLGKPLADLRMVRIQELPLAPIASFISKTFVRVGYQYYDPRYTGSNNWIGAPVSMSDLTASPMNAQMLPPVNSAHNVYATFEVRL